MGNAPIENCNSTTEDAAVWDFLLLCYSTVIPTSNVIKGLKKAFLSFKYGWFSHIQRIQHVASVFPQRP